MAAIVLASAFVWLGLPHSELVNDVAHAQAVAVFSRIDVAGNQRTSADTVRSIAGIEAGVAVRPAEINEAVRRLFESDLFEDVNIRPEGGRLIIEVRERPTINEIAIEGNRILRDEILETLITSERRQTFSPARAEADAQALIDAYTAAGRLNARVTPRFIRRSENRVDLVFEVFEGEIVEIARVGFVGNHRYSDGRLRRVLATKQANLLSWLFSSDTFVEDRIEHDRALLEEFYRSRGFIDFEVLSVTSELTRERDAFLVTFRVREGAQFSFGRISISTELPDVDPDDFTDLVGIDPGETFNEETLDRLLDEIGLRINERGLAFVQTAHEISRDNDSRRVDIDIRLVRGPRLFVERIEITGNSTTLDSVIRRQFRIVEGDPFNRREVQRAADRIRALGYFGNVAVDAREGSSPEQAVIDVVVEERPTGSLTFGVAYTTGQGVGGNIALTETNFRGRGQTIGASISTLDDDSLFSFNFEEPHFLDRNLLVGVSLYQESNRSDSFSFESRETGFSPRIAFPLGESSRLALNYDLSVTDVKESPDEGSGVSPLLGPGDLSKTLKSAVGGRYTLNRTDSLVEPTRGYVLRVSQNFAGLGGDVKYSKTAASGRVYRGLLRDDVVLSAEFEGGVLVPLGGQDSRVRDRFFLGGDSFRGFRTFGIGPRDEDGGPLGGKYFVMSRLEVSFPLGLPEELGLLGAVFLDAGSLWGLDSESVEDERCAATAGVCTADSPSFDLRASVGISFYWNTAIGPLRFNFAKPVEYVEGIDRLESFRFTVGTRF
ncbi:MAG: outer membrane protein assembly factor BamA [Paracoccaceae bacterium]|nr:outer membrane protein assembly factor BamA [Paracoccaceae bacterium]MDE2914983.1 outer membrane protein assembly factor BamA [Paracoccaceae bacterium]